ncbi:hypothetical protein [Komagataeibacter diospyri]|uniref:Uncharacterized protein n=1 Tax=Komagataeibacter diospyri TaxID=1932662 RepID=A0A4P5NSQ3_9PROT|nr:hypothetical protein [Komagataeibacter diospyri]GCE82595.1 hypothetical protein MSKU9_0736 [Komagataeibacter diospyri]GCE88934.1 hypothetical protein MSKU15_0535 [Komagataeibacter diospyri]
MGRRTDRLHDLPGTQLDQEIRGGFFVLRHTLMEVARDASMFGGNPGISERPVIGTGALLRKSLIDIARTCQRDYVLRGGTMEFESTGALHVLWVRITAATGGGRLVFGPKSADPGLLLVDLTLNDEADSTAVSIVFRDVTRLTVTYDVGTDITLIGLLSGAPTTLDCNAWAVVRLRGNVCGLTEDNSQYIAGDNDFTNLYIRHYQSRDKKEICITIKK